MKLLLILFALVGCHAEVKPITSYCVMVKEGWNKPRGSYLLCTKERFECERIKAVIVNQKNFIEGCFPN